MEKTRIRRKRARSSEKSRRFLLSLESLSLGEGKKLLRGKEERISAFYIGKEQNIKGSES